MSVLFPLIVFVLPCITQRYMCGMSWEDYAYTCFRDDFTHLAFSVFGWRHFFKGAGLKTSPSSP